MLRWSRWTCAALLALALLSATARADHYRTIVVSPAPVVVAPAPVVRYYTPPAVSYYTPAPVVRSYTPDPIVTTDYYYAPTTVRSYYPATVVAPTVTSYRYGVFGLRRLDVVDYTGAAVVPVRTVPARSYYYSPRVIVYP